MGKLWRFVIPTAVIVLLLGFSLTLQTAPTQAQDFGSNWTASYFDNKNLSGGAELARIENQINANFGNGAPQIGISGFPSNDFSIRWQGLQTFDASGTYRFQALYDDGIRVRIDGSTIMDDFNESGSTQTRSVDVNVSAGVRDIVVEYVEYEGNAAVQFFWQPVDVAAAATAGPSPTPSTTPLPSIPSGALRATVIRASVLNVRDAPSLGGNRVSQILRGQTYQVVGRNADARWFLLDLGGFQAWAYGYYLFIDGNEYNAPVRSATTVFGLPGGFNDTGVLVQTHATMRMRSEPDVFAPQTGRITWGAFLPVAGRTAAGDWYQVLWKGTVGWVYVGFLDIVQGDYDDIPVIR